MIKDEFWYQLTEWNNYNQIRFAIDQLREYGAKEGVDYVVKPNGKKRAVFTKGEKLDLVNPRMIKGCPVLLRKSDE